jgi:hypothetical protein
LRKSINANDIIPLCEAETVAYAKTFQILQRLRQVNDLSFVDKKLLFLATLALPAIAFSLQNLGYKKTKTILSRLLPAAPAFHSHPNHQMSIALNFARIIDITARHSIYKANCLKQSLLLWFLLRRQSIPAEIKFGIPKAKPYEFSAHAWVECYGQPLIDSRESLEIFSMFESSQDDLEKGRNGS